MSCAPWKHTWVKVSETKTTFTEECRNAECTKRHTKKKPV